VGWLSKLSLLGVHPVKSRFLSFSFDNGWLTATAITTATTATATTAATTDTAIAAASASDDGDVDDNETPKPRPRSYSASANYSPAAFSISPGGCEERRWLGAMCVGV